jgi:hypothetical protein
MILLVLRLKAELIARWERAPEAKVADLPGAGLPHYRPTASLCQGGVRQFFVTSYREFKDELAAECRSDARCR